MTFFRIYSAVCACGGPDSGPGASTGGGGAGSGGKSGVSCNPTHCTKDIQYNLYSQAYCDSIPAQPCATTLQAQLACSLAHDKCKADDTQDRDVFHAACQAEIDAFDNCAASQ
jgi:hypothetical protein